MLAVLMNLGFAGGGSQAPVATAKYTGFIVNVGKLMSR